MQKQYLPRIKISNGKTFNNSPHLVILGAGASIACMKNTANGKKMPSMNELNDLAEVQDIFKKHSVKIKGNESFEDFFSRIHNEEYGDLKKELEQCIWDYFSDIEIDDKPNLYDKLILSLRGKDYIATFNWDPLLILSYIRHKKIGENKLPKLLFLHGNVGEGICYDCKILCNFHNKICHRCHKELSKSKLLYPIGKKDYNSDPVIKNNWNILRDVLSRAYIITIFGYSAPVSDVEAKEILLDNYKKSKHLELSEIEIINNSDRKKIEETWSDMFFSHHYCIFDKLSDSFILKHPRRSCDSHASACLQCDPVEEHPFPDFDDFDDIYSFLDPLISEEENEELE